MNKRDLLKVPEIGKKLKEKVKRVRKPKADVSNDFKSTPEQLEKIISNLCADCRGWREKYNILLKRYEKDCISPDEKALLKHYEKCNIDREAYARSNRYMDEELKRRGEYITKLEADNSALTRKVKDYENRGFFDRLFNVKC